MKRHKREMRMMLVMAAAALFTGAALAPSASAGVIAVTNGNFESQSPALIAGQNYFTAPTGWTIDTGKAGPLDVPDLTSAFYGGDPGAAFDVLHGDVLLTTQGAAAQISQTLATQYAANTIYILSVLVGDSYENASATTLPAWSIELVSGSTVLSTTSASGVDSPGKYDPNNPDDHHIMATVSLDTTGSTGVVGTPITIRIIGNTNGTSAFDNVTLTSSVPEPTSVSLALLGLGGLLMLTRRRNVSSC